MTDSRFLTPENVARLEAIGYSRKAAEMTLAQIEQLGQDLKDSFARWLETGEIGGPTVLGYNARFLVETLGDLPPGAFVTIGWLRGDLPGYDPKDALRVLRRGALRKGVSPPASSQL